MPLTEPLALACAMLLIAGALSSPLEAAESVAGGSAAPPPLPPPAERRRLPPDGGEKYNRLIHETSPYLLQHAANPVDWYPWGEEAFARARKLGRPIFLSIGYSSCHWCHVMERESFDNPAVARLLNTDFVCIKVDREERPDIDAVYMHVCQMLTGSGGWPLTIVMTPQRQPFFAATYIPAKAMYGRPGMTQLLPRIAELWRTKRTQLNDSARRIIAALRGSQATAGKGKLAPELLRVAARQLADVFDHEHGGFGGAPKFPTAHQLLFLLRYWHDHGDKQALAMVEQTLRAMWRGGIHDHLGGGFHRYSTDRRWLVPHFEKMLYDQALLAMTATECFQATRAPFYERMTDDIFRYARARLRHPQGAFYTAEDADSGGGEGSFYLWSVQQVSKLLPVKDAELFIAAYGMLPGGNFDSHLPEHTGGNILHLPLPLADFARSRHLAEEALRQRLARCRGALMGARARRVRPARDDKILTDINGLMIAALAKAGEALDRAEYRDAARQAADFILQRLRDPDGGLLHSFAAGRARIPANLNDYAFLCWGLLETYRATRRMHYLAAAQRLARAMVADFWDPKAKGFYLSSPAAKHLPLRQKVFFDAALPSGNAVALLVLVRLARITGDAELARCGRELGQLMAPMAAARPAAFTGFLLGARLALAPPVEIVVAGKPGNEDTAPFLAGLRGVYAPDLDVLVRDPEAGKELDRLAPAVVGRGLVDGHPAAYVCIDRACRLPATDAKTMLEQLGYAPGSRRARE